MTTLRIHRAAGALGALLLPSVALAGGFNFYEHGFYLIDFLILVGILLYALKKPIKAFLQNRHDTVVKELDEAKQLREAAKAKLDEYESRLADLEAEKQRIVAEFVQAGERERDRILSEANKAVVRIAADAERRAEQESKRLSEMLQNELIAQVVSTSEELVNQRMDASAQRRLVDESIAAIDDSKTELAEARNTH